MTFLRHNGRTCSQLLFIVTDNVKGYGMASFPDQRATPETLYYCGSTTKSFTAAAVLKLIEESKSSKSPLSLKTKIQSLIPENFVLQDDYATQHVTLEDILSHRTGMPLHNNCMGGPDDTLSKLVRRLRHLPMTAEIREKFQYSNIMYLALSYVVETISGSWLGNFYREHFWRRLEMHSTFLTLQDARNAAAAGTVQFATGYWWDDASTEYIEAPYLDRSRLVSGAGAIISNVLDYAKYLRAMIVRDTRFVSADSFRELRIPRIVIPYDGPPKGFTGPEMYGLGWRYAVYRGHEVFFHGGGVPGFGAFMAYMPSLSNGIGLALMANSENTSSYVAQVLLFAIVDDILGPTPIERFDWLGHFDQVWEKTRASRDPEVARKKFFPDAPDAKDALPMPLPLEHYVGEYWNDGYLKLTVEVAEDAEPLPTQDKPSKFLRINIRDKPWQQIIHFLHVTGNYFLAWSTCPKRATETVWNMVMAAEFELGVSGKVAKMGIAFEDSMNGEKVWFDKTE